MLGWQYNSNSNSEIYVVNNVTLAWKSPSDSVCCSHHCLIPPAHRANEAYGSAAVKCYSRTAWWSLWLVEGHVSWCCSPGHPQVLNRVEVFLCCAGATLACFLSWPQPHWVRLDYMSGITSHSCRFFYLFFQTKRESPAKLIHTLSCLWFTEAYNQPCKYSLHSAVNTGSGRQVPGLGGPSRTVVGQEAGNIFFWPI